MIASRLAVDPQPANHWQAEKAVLCVTLRAINPLGSAIGHSRLSWRQNRAEHRRWVGTVGMFASAASAKKLSSGGRQGGKAPYKSRLDLYQCG